MQANRPNDTWRPSPSYRDSPGSHQTTMIGPPTPAGPERVQSTRKISSTIVGSQLLGPPPSDLPVRQIFVDGPYEERIMPIQQKEVVVQNVKYVPRTEYVEKPVTVFVPKIEYIEKEVEVPEYYDVVKEVKVPQYVDVPKEYIREVKVPRVKYVEQKVEVPGEIIEVPKPYPVEQIVEFTRYTDRKHPVVVAQTIKPIIVEGAGVAEVDVYEYEPECIPVDVHVVKGVTTSVSTGNAVETNHKVVTVPVAQYNSILQQINPHLHPEELSQLPYQTGPDGRPVFCGEKVSIAEPHRGVHIQGLDLQNMVTQYVDYASKKVTNVESDFGIQHHVATTLDHGDQTSSISYLPQQTVQQPSIPIHGKAIL